MKNKRLENALRREGCWPAIRMDLLEAWDEARTALRDAEATVRELAAWKAFYEGERATEYSESGFRLYFIDDTWHVAAKSVEQALELYCEYCCLTDQERDEAGVEDVAAGKPLAVFDPDEETWEIMTAADWANVSKPTMVSSNEY